MNKGTEVKMKDGPIKLLFRVTSIIFIVLIVIGLVLLFKEPELNSLEIGRFVRYTTLFISGFSGMLFLVIWRYTLNKVQRLDELKKVRLDYGYAFIAVAMLIWVLLSLLNICHEDGYLKYVYHWHYVFQSILSALNSLMFLSAIEFMDVFEGSSSEKYSKLWAAVKRSAIWIKERIKRKNLFLIFLIVLFSTLILGIIGNSEDWQEVENFIDDGPNYIKIPDLLFSLMAIICLGTVIIYVFRERGIIQITFGILLSITLLFTLIAQGFKVFPIESTLVVLLSLLFKFFLIVIFFCLVLTFIAQTDFRRLLLYEQLKNARIRNERMLNAFGHDFRHMLNTRKVASSFHLKDKFEIVPIEKENQNTFGEIKLARELVPYANEFVVFPFSPVAHFFSDLGFLWAGKYSKESITLENGKIPSNLVEGLEAAYLFARKVMAVITVANEPQLTINQIQLVPQKHQIIYEVFSNYEIMSDLDVESESIALKWDHSHLPYSSQIMRLFYTLCINTLKHCDPSEKIKLSIRKDKQDYFFVKVINHKWPKGEAVLSNEFVAKKIDYLDVDTKKLTMILGSFQAAKSGLDGIQFEKWHTKDIISDLIGHLEGGEIIQWGTRNDISLSPFTTEVKFAKKLIK